ncbi:MAG: chemotaxis protein CheW [Phycisphaerales bacterium]|nr:chemotaxis protein CheW [Phycisphaerales bacterium]
MSHEERAINTGVAAKNGTPAAVREVPEAPLQLVTFELGGERFAVEIDAVREIIRLVELTRVPNSPPDIAGVINLRGTLFPVIDLRIRFGFPVVARDDHSRIVVLTPGGRGAGFIVDRVHEVLNLDQKTMCASPEMIGSIDADCVKGIAGIGERLLIVLEPGKLFHFPEPADAGTAADAA